MTEGINIGNLSEMINDKMDRDLMNALVKTDFVVESKAPDENDPTWYRVYKSGWLEQGGAFPAPGDSGSNPYTLNYPKAFNDTSYYINMAYTNNTNHCAYYDINIRSKTVQSSIITTHCSGTWYGATVVWEAKGFCADNSMEGDDGETVFGNTYKTYFYNGTDLDYTNIVGPKTPVEMASFSFPKSGVIMGWVNPADNGTCRLKINNQNVWGADYYMSPIYIPVKKDDVFSYEGIDNVSTIAQNSLWFVPYSEPAQSTNPTVTQIIDAIYPVGSIYIGTTVNCPIASIVGTWEKIDGDLVLQSSSSTHQANTTIEAGLPNITGTINQVYLNSAGSDSGALKRVTENTNATWTAGSGWGGNRINFNASQSNPIYGNSDTVQPPAYVVNVWKRTA